MGKFRVSAVALDGQSGDGGEVEASDAAEAAEIYLATRGWGVPFRVTSVEEVPVISTGWPRTVGVTFSDVFGDSVPNGDEVFIEMADWSRNVHYFVGRNGSGKSRTARAVAAAADGRILTTDRLIGLMNVVNFGWGVAPTDYKGIPLGDDERRQILEWARTAGLGTSELYALREEPEVLLRVAAFVRRALGRTIELRETAGFLDPFIRVGSTEYSLLRDEGHGLRELIVLLAAVYRRDWHLLLVDEAELHLHPSMARLWLAELNKECDRTGRSAIVVTHEPSFLRPRDASDLESIWMFSAGAKPKRMSDGVLEIQRDRIGSSLAQNPKLVSDLVFSPRPVLLEGVTDVAAMSTALSRVAPPEVVAQTDLVDCGGSGGVALWLEVCTKLGIDARAVCDLDALWDSDMQRTLNTLPGLEAALVEEFTESPPRIATVLRPLHRAADAGGVNADPASRGAWLAELDPSSVEGVRKTRLLELLTNRGVWLHPQGTLEQVLGISRKGVTEATSAAAVAGALDVVAEWAAYELDLHGDIKELLDVAVERVAHSIMEALRENPGAQFTSTVGASAQADARIVSVTPLNDGVHRLEVIAPAAFAGWWLEFSRNSRAVDLELQPPL
tara:strand:- start:5519 stop:7366 length:1848 start_codon:yes stop_codon:yes gene_type:complete